jgi:hypothetical protein
VESLSRPVDGALLSDSCNCNYRPDDLPE